MLHCVALGTPHRSRALPFTELRIVHAVPIFLEKCKTSRSPRQTLIAMFRFATARLLLGLRVYIFSWNTLKLQATFRETICTIVTKIVFVEDVITHFYATCFTHLHMYALLLRNTATLSATIKTSHRERPPDGPNTYATCFTHLHMYALLLRNTATLSATIKDIA